VSEIERIIKSILFLESNDIPNWAEIKRISDNTIDRIQGGDIPKDFPHTFYQFLDDYDIRERDNRYAEWQRQQIRHIVGFN